MLTKKFGFTLSVCLILVLVAACSSPSVATSVPRDLPTKPVFNVPVATLRVPTLAVPAVEPTVDITVVNNSGKNLCWIYLVAPGSTDFENVLYNVNFVDTGTSAVIEDVKVGYYDVHGLTCSFTDVSKGFNLAMDAQHSVLTLPPIAEISAEDQLAGATVSLVIVNVTATDICSVGLTRPGDLTVILGFYEWKDTPIGLAESHIVKGIKPGIYDITLFDCLKFPLVHVNNTELRYLEHTIRVTR